MSFDVAEIQLMRANQLSSVFREVKNIRLALETIVSQLGPNLFTGKVIVYTGDCMPAIQDLQKVKGTVNVFQQLVLFVALHDIDLDFIWESRESDALLHADMLSRVEDSSEIFMSKSVYICAVNKALAHVARVDALAAGNRCSQRCAMTDKMQQEQHHKQWRQ